jgi:hypothetical protein
VLAFGLALSVQARLPRGPLGADRVPVVPDPSAARIAALDFEALASDFYWLRAVQLVGDERLPTRKDAPRIAQLAALVVALDPWVDHPYRFAALWASDDRDSLAQADRLLERGIAYHPADWRDRFYLGFDKFFYEHDPATAAQELEPAVSLPGAPLFLGRLVARLRAEGGDLDAAEGFLRALLQNAPDDRHRDQYRRALEEVETERLARMLDRARQLYQLQNGHDIASVQDLVRAPDGVMAALPLGPHGAPWELGATGEIVSSYYGHRYRVQIQHRVARASGSDRSGTAQRAEAARRDAQR